MPGPEGWVAFLIGNFVSLSLEWALYQGRFCKRSLSDVFFFWFPKPLTFQEIIFMKGWKKDIRNLLPEKESLQWLFSAPSFGILSLGNWASSLSDVPVSCNGICLLSKKFLYGDLRTISARLVIILTALATDERDNSSLSRDLLFMGGVDSTLALGWSLFAAEKSIRGDRISYQRPVIVRVRRSRI